MPLAVSFWHKRATSLPADCSRGLWLAGLEVAALSCGAGRVGEDGAGGGVTAGVVAVVLQISTNQSTVSWDLDQ